MTASSIFTISIHPFTGLAPPPFPFAFITGLKNQFDTLINKNFPDTIAGVSPGASIVMGKTAASKINSYIDYLDLIREAGIVGAGGAGFPSYIKYQQKIVGGTIIANGAECEPLHKHNITQLIENHNDVIEGIEYVMKITSASNGIIAIKNKHK
ncbi:hypothetical protein KJ891_03825, partial [Candidatus Micrarchaeota archaeon]|nr:hypothetical protein [Candidatus Micrarchaeota archaeon]